MHIKNMLKNPYKNMHVHRTGRKHTFSHTYTRTHTHTHARTHARTHAHTHTHTPWVKTSGKENDKLSEKSMWREKARKSEWSLSRRCAWACTLHWKGPCGQRLRRLCRFVRKSCRLGVPFSLHCGWHAQVWDAPDIHPAALRPDPGGILPGLRQLPKDLGPAGGGSGQADQADRHAEGGDQQREFAI